MRKLLVGLFLVWCVVVLARISLPSPLREAEREDELMRRKNPISVRVKAPSRGLVTRLPSELADTFKEPDLKRTFVTAKNVRFEDGVVASAPGYSPLGITGDSTTPMSLNTLVTAYYKLDEAVGFVDLGRRKDSVRLNEDELDLVAPYGQDVAVYDVYGSEYVPATELGKHDNAAVLASNFDKFYSDSTTFACADTSFTWTGWVYVTAVPTGGQTQVLGRGGVNLRLTPQQQTFAAFGDLGNNDEYQVFLERLSPTTMTLGFQVQEAGGTVTTVRSSVALALNTWYFFSAQHTDGVSIKIRVNSTAGTPSAHTLSIRDTGIGTFFSLGGNAYGAQSAPFRLDSVAFWKGTNLTTTQENFLYNSGAGLDYPFTSPCNAVMQGNVLQDDPFPLVFGTTSNLYLIGKTYDGSTRTFTGSYSSIYSVPGGVTVDVARRWTFCDFYDKMVFAQEDCPPQYHFGGNATADVAGLADNSSYAGCTAFQNHLMLWKDTTLSWSDLNDMNLWIPVAETIFSGRFTLTSSFTQPAGGGTTSSYVYSSESTDGLTVGQYVRVSEPSTAQFVISNATNASPIVLTTTSAHSYAVGDKVNVTGVLGNTAANGTWVVSAVGGSTVTLTGSVGNGTYTSGGVVRRIPFDNFYTVTEVTPVGDTATEVIAPSATGGNQTLGASTTSTVLTLTTTDWEVGAHVVTGVNSQVMVVAEVGTNPAPSGVPYFTIKGTPAYNAATMDVDHDNTGLRANVDYVSIAESSNPAVDCYLVTGVTLVRPAGLPAYTTLTLTRKAVGTNVRTSGTHPAGSYVVWTPWIKLTNSGSAITFDSATNTSAASRTLTLQNGFKLKAESLTGRRGAGSSVASGLTMVTLDANEAGEAQIVGASDNGPIKQVVPLGDYAIIFKNRAVQAAQYVGRLSGTFFIRTEIRDEGLVGRNAFVRLSDNRLVFLGNRELYDYRGGSNLTSVCMQYTRTLFSEMDFSRIDEIVMHHREARNEVWVVFPVRGGQKVLVWNYVEDTATLDDYSGSFSDFSAVGQTRWSTDPTWVNFGTTLWSQISDTTYWNTLIGSGEESNTLIASGDGQILIHGTEFNRDGAAYTCSCETMDHDFGDPDAVKYVDAVAVQLQIPNVDPTATKILYVQAGTKMNADSSVSWGTAQTLYVQGDGQSLTKVNPGGSGRFVRLRFYSEDADVEWRISGYEIHARKGNTY